MKTRSLPAVMLLSTILPGLAATAVPVAHPDAQALLHQSDRARGGGLPGVVWEIRLQAREGDRVLEPQRLEVRAVDDASVAETLAPPRFRGTKLLQVGHNMWLTNPRLAKPIPVSPRQRMLGQAANGDIAATNYAADYRAVLTGEEAVDGEPCWVLALTARHRHTTYDRVRYWISQKRRVGVKAEFYSLSGKLLKTARFDYGQTIEYAGRHIPFVSRMRIRDALRDAETVMTYGAVAVHPVPAADFDLGQIQ
jgi:hypothetical protein